MHAPPGSSGQDWTLRTYLTFTAVSNVLHMNPVLKTRSVLISQILGGGG